MFSLLWWSNPELSNIWKRRSNYVENHKRALFIISRVNCSLFRKYFLLNNRQFTCGFGECTISFFSPSLLKRSTSTSTHKCTLYSQRTATDNNSLYCSKWHWPCEVVQRSYSYNESGGLHRAKLKMWVRF